MLTLTELSEYHLGPSVVCMGKFDGVHRGHVKLLSTTVRLARQMNAKSVAVTFDVNPAAVLRGGEAPEVLTQKEQKRALIEKIGLDVLITVPFTQEFAALGANEYLQWLCNQLTPVCVVSGEDFHFGKGASGNAALIHQMAAELGYRAVTVRLLKADGRVISSTAVREALRRGEREAAERMLGRHIDQG